MYTLLPEQNAVKIKLEYTIKNIGSVAAKKLAVFDEIGKTVAQLKAEFKGLKIPNKITLGPGQSHIIGTVALVGFNDKNGYDKYIQKLSSKVGIEMTFQIGVNYVSEINPNQKFHSTVANKITKERAEIIKIEFEEE